jgi:outer membrane beta-barrel protein
VEDFEVGVLLGARLAYHANETLFLEVSAGQSTSLETAFERLSGTVQLIPEGEDSLFYYQLSAGLNILTGEFFWEGTRAWNMAWYVVGGVGATDFGGDTSFTVHGGTGLRWLVSDWIALHATMQLQAYDTDLLGESETAINLSWLTGISFFF